MFMSKCRPGHGFDLRFIRLWRDHWQRHHAPFYAEIHASPQLPHTALPHPRNRKSSCRQMQEHFPLFPVHLHIAHHEFIHGRRWSNVGPRPFWDGMCRVASAPDRQVQLPDQPCGINLLAKCPQQVTATVVLEPRCVCTDQSRVAPLSSGIIRHRGNEVLEGLLIHDSRAGMKTTP